MRIQRKILLIWLIIIFFIFIINSVIQDYSIIYYITSLLLILGIIISASKGNLLSSLNLFVFIYLYFIALGPIGFYFIGEKHQNHISSFIVVGLIFFILGYQIAKMFFNKIIFRKNDYFQLNISNSSLVIKICLSIIFISILSNILYLYNNRNYFFTGNLDVGRISAQSGNGLLLRLGNMWMVASYVLIELKLKNVKIPFLSYLGMIIGIILAFFSGSRTNVIAFLLIIFLMIGKRKKISTSKIFIFGLFTIIFLFIYRFFRDNLQTNNKFGNIIFELFLRESYTGCINLEYMINTFPKKHPFFMGYGYLINFLMLMPGPDLDFTLTLKEIVGIDFRGGGITPTILGEFYINFGYFFSYLGMLIFGLYFYLLDIYRKKTDIYFLPLFLLVNVLLSIRAGIANQEIVILVTLIPYVLICKISNNIILKR